MPRPIDWHYRRKACTTCQNAQAFLDAQGCPPAAVVIDATKERHSPEQALALVRSVQKLVVARGKKTTVIPITADSPDDTTLLGHLIGPTGNLRAPTLKVGPTLLVGFNEDAYREVLLST